MTGLRIEACFIYHVKKIPIVRFAYQANGARACSLGCISDNAADTNVITFGSLRSLSRGIFCEWCEGLHLCNLKLSGLSPARE